MPASPPSPVVIWIPLIPSHGEFAVTEAMVAEWKEAYPGIDVAQWLRTIRQWNVSHPTRRKTRKGILAHITNWLAKEQNRAPRGAAPNPAPSAVTCEYPKGGEPCGMPNARMTSRYAKPLCAHCERQLVAAMSRDMPDAVRSQLRRFIRKPQEA